MSNEDELLYWDECDCCFIQEIDPVVWDAAYMAGLLAWLRIRLQIREYRAAKTYRKVSMKKLKKLARAKGVILSDEEARYLLEELYKDES